MHVCVEILEDEKSDFYLMYISPFFCFQDDAKVVELVGKYGAKKWSSIANELKGRIGKQCRYIICYFF